MALLAMLAALLALFGGGFWIAERASEPVPATTTFTLGARPHTYKLCRSHVHTTAAGVDAITSCAIGPLLRPKR